MAHGRQSAAERIGCCEGKHTGAVLGDTSKGAGSHVLDEGEIGWEGLIAIRNDAVSAGSEFAVFF